jgi:hypothetical protein
MRDIETIDSELRLVAALRRCGIRWMHARCRVLVIGQVEKRSTLLP